MPAAWVFQDDKQVKEHGEEAASWYVGWYTPEGKRKCKSCGPGAAGKRVADKLARKIEAELNTGTYDGQSNATWEDFRKEWEAKVGAGMGATTRRLTREALDHFERLVRPGKTWFLAALHIDHYVSLRRCERGHRPGETVSPATVNKELRHLRAVLRVGKDWGYLKEVPRFRMLREPREAPTYVTGEHFALVYGACGAARLPHHLPANVTPADWWRGLLVTAYMTGWRVSEVLCLRRDWLDRQAGTAFIPAARNKGRKDVLVQMHPVVWEHLDRLAGFGPVVFPWPHANRTLYSEFARVQEAAGVNLPCRKEHEHGRHCHLYGFHDLRRAFATVNADRMTADALQALMRHESYLTTQKYINMARQINQAVGNLHVPEVLRKPAGGEAS
jgi:integrase